MAETDDDLLAKAVAGDEDALTQLLERCGPEVRRRMRGKIAAKWRSVLDDDDVMQVTYLEAFLGITRFIPSGSGSFHAWLVRMAENNLRDAIKELERAKRPPPSRRVEPIAEESFASLFEMLDSTSATPSRLAARAEARHILETAIASLPPDYAKVVRLYDLQSLPPTEVAQAMQRSVGAVFMLRARAHDRLRDALGSSSRFFSHPA